MVGNRVDNAQTYAYTPPTPVVGLVDDDDAASQDQEEPIAWNKLGIYITKIVGLQYYAGKVGKGENVILVRDARNKYDANAIKAVNIHNTQIGHIPRMVAGVMAPLLDASKIRLEGICPTGTRRLCCGD
jgi:SWI/SNF-related matrix-associated actin-dependent regulator of chromatin subfamily A3